MPRRTTYYAIPSAVTFSNLYAADGNGVSSYGTNASITDDLKLLDTFTLSFWWNPTIRSVNQYLVQISDHRINDYKIQVFGSNGTTLNNEAINIRTLDTSGNRIWYQYFNYEINNWYHVVILAGVNSLVLYVDGVLQTPQYIVTNQTQSGNLRQPNRMTIGALWVPGYFFYFTDHYYDEISIFNRHITSAEIAQLAEGTRDISTWSGLVGWWRLEQNGDDSAGDNDLTLNSFSFIDNNLPPEA